MDFKKANFFNKEVREALKSYSIHDDDLIINELEAVANNNYRITGKNFDVVLKVYSHGQSDKTKIEKELEAMKLFEKRGIKVPEMIKGKDQKYLQQYKGFNLVLTKFIAGPTFDTIEFTDKKMYEVGKIVAEVENASKDLDISKFDTMNFHEEFDYVNTNLEKEIKSRNYDFDLTNYYKYFPKVIEIIDRLEKSDKQQFLHKDIWPYNLIDSKEGIYLLDFNDWSTGDPIIEMAVSLMEFGMFKSEKLNKKVVEKIIEGYRSVKPLNYSSKEIWEAILFLCYLYFAYNVIQADNKFE